jgi:hypothetical protein
MAPTIIANKTANASDGSTRSLLFTSFIIPKERNPIKEKNMPEKMNISIGFMAFPS